MVKSCFLLFNSRFFLVYMADYFHIEFRLSAFVGKQTVKLLFNVCQLCITESYHHWII